MRREQINEKECINMKLLQSYFCCEKILFIYLTGLMVLTNNICLGFESYQKSSGNAADSTIYFADSVITGLPNDTSLKKDNEQGRTNIYFNTGLPEFAAIGIEFVVSGDLNIGLSYSGQLIGNKKKNYDFLTAIPGINISVVYIFKELDLPECLFDFNYISLGSKFFNDKLTGYNRGLHGLGFELLTGYKSRLSGLHIFYGLGVSYSIVLDCYDLIAPVFKIGIVYNFN